MRIVRRIGEYEIRFENGTTIKTSNINELIAIVENEKRARFEILLHELGKLKNVKWSNSNITELICEHGKMIVTPHLLTIILNGIKVFESKDESLIERFSLF